MNVRALQFAIRRMNDTSCLTNKRVLPYVSLYSIVILLFNHTIWRNLQNIKIIISLSLGLTGIDQCFPIF